MIADIDKRIIGKVMRKTCAERRKIRMQEEYHAKGKKLYMCFVDLEKALDRVPRNVLEWSMMNK